MQFTVFHSTHGVQEAATWMFPGVDQLPMAARLAEAVKQRIRGARAEGAAARGPAPASAPTLPRLPAAGSQCRNEGQDETVQVLTSGPSTPPCEENINQLRERAPSEGPGDRAGDTEGVPRLDSYMAANLQSQRCLEQKNGSQNDSQSQLYHSQNQQYDRKKQEYDRQTQQYNSQNRQYDSQNQIQQYEYSAPSVAYVIAGGSIVAGKSCCSCGQAAPANFGTPPRVINRVQGDLLFRKV